MTVRTSFLGALSVVVLVTTSGCGTDAATDPTTVNLGRCSCVCRADTSGATAAWGATFVESPEAKACLDVCAAHEVSLEGKSCRPVFNSKFEAPKEVAPPDSDLDGVPDAKDQCPNETGPAQNAGCPPFKNLANRVVDNDTDGDGIPNDADKCPKEPETKNGYKDDDGCPDEVPSAVAKFSGAIEGIVFKTGSAVLDNRSTPVLTKAADVFKKYPDIRVEIGGHTDNVGSSEVNTTLSQKRAEAVKDWFVKKGISAGRLEAKGFGPSKPVSDNDSEAGRAKNRRVEFRLVQ